MIVADEGGDLAAAATFFASGDESRLDGCARRVLEALRAMLSRLEPTTIDPAATLTRPELGERTS
jgi:hypothetical protein